MDEVVPCHQLFDLRLVVGEAEEQVLLIPPLQRLLVDRAAGIDGLGWIVFVFLASDAVPAGLPAADDVP